MKYKRIILVGYKRMRLNGIHYFEMVLTSDLQLILGTNGCGKSSLLWEISPLPANSNDFEPGGKKVIEFEHKGQHYILSSSFEGKQEHSFVVEGLGELNPGHTITVQKELIKDHFKITQDIQELLTGQECFDTMSVARRKDWFLRLCDVNYDYALNVFGRLKHAHRDRTGAIRLEKKALVVESEKLLSEQEIVKISEETQWLHDCLSHLLEHRKPVESDLDTLDMESMQADKQLVQMTNQFVEIHQRINDREHDDSELTDFIEHSSSRMTVAQTKIGMLSSQLEQVLSKVDVLNVVGENTIASLEHDIAQATAELEAMSKSAILQEPLVNPERAYAVFESIKAPLAEIFNTIPSNSDKKYTSAALGLARTSLDEKNRLKGNTLQWLAEQRASLAHMRDHLGKPDVSCPKCNHAFSLVYSEERMLSLTSAMREREDSLATVLNPEISELELFIENCANYGTLYRQFVYATGSAKALTPYWDWINLRKTLTDAPDQGSVDLQRIEQDLLQQLGQWRHRERLQALKNNLDQLKSIGEADLSELLAQSKILDSQLSEETQQLQLAQASHGHYKAQLALRAQMAAVRRGIRKIIYTQRALLKGKIEHQRRTILNRLIRDLQSALATREQALFTAKRQKEVVDAMIRKIDILTQEELALGILVKELSPTEGLIAEGMLGFIKNYCASMNELVSKVWSYPLLIQSCEVVEGESIDLDYRFPLLEGEELHRVDDVIKGSEGMREMINLAFRITAMQYLNMDDFPLILDEIGRTFDKAHRTAASAMIRSLIEQNTFPQVLLVSHYEGVYGALAGAEVCVLNDTNITVPEHYNAHVITKV